MDPLLWRNIRAQQHWSGNLFLVNSVSVDQVGLSEQQLPLMGTSLQFRRHWKAPQLESPPPEVHWPHWECFPRLADRWRLDRGSPLKLLPNPSEPLHLVNTTLDVSHQKWGGLTLRANSPLTHLCGKPGCKPRNFLILGEFTNNYAHPVHEVFQHGAGYLRLPSP